MLCACGEAISLYGNFLNYKIAVLAMTIAQYRIELLNVQVSDTTEVDSSNKSITKNYASVACICSATAFIIEFIKAVELSAEEF